MKRSSSSRVRQRLTSIGIVFCLGMAVGTVITKSRSRGHAAAAVAPQYDSTAGRNPLLQLRHYHTDAMFEGGAGEGGNVFFVFFPPPQLVVAFCQKDSRASPHTQQQ